MERADRREEASDQFPAHGASDDRSGLRTAAPESEIDLERLIWDLDYRAWAKDRMTKNA